MRRALAALVLVAGACKPSVDFDTPRAYRCDDDGQCAGGWRCGVAGFCLDPHDAGENACHSDTDCFEGKRCNLDQRCVDFSSELLGPNDSPPGDIQVIGPSVAPSGVDGEQVAWAIEPRTGDPLLDAQRSWTMAVGVSGQVTALTGVGSPQQIVALDAGSFPGIVSLAASERTAWVLTQGGLYGIDVSTAPAPGATVHLAGVDPSWALHDVGLNGWSLISFPTDGGNALQLVSSTAADAVRTGPSGPSIGLDYLGFGPCLLAARKGGIWVGSSSGDAGLRGASPDGGWPQLELPDIGPACGMPFGGLVPSLRVRGAQPNLLAVAYERKGPPDDSVRDAGFTPKPSMLALYDVSRLVSDVAAAPDGGGAACLPQPGPTGSCGDERVERLIGPCAPCGLVDEQLLDFFPLTLDTRRGLQADCIGGAGVHTYQITQSLDGICELVRITATDPKYTRAKTPLFGGANPFGLGKAGQHGELWAGDSLIDADPVFLDRPARGLYRPSSAGDAGVVAVHAFADEVVTAQSASGFARVSKKFDVPIVASVGGFLDQVVFADRRVARIRRVGNAIGNFTVAVVDASDATFAAPFAAKAYRRSDGVLQYMVRSNDSIYGAEASTNSVPFLRLQVLPAPGAPILAFVVGATSDADAGLSEGWALTRTGLFGVRQDALGQWSSIEVPTAVGNRVAVFQEGRKGRLGYDDGTVYALPSRVPIASAVPGMSVTSYQYGCDETWAIANTGLMRLQPTDAGTGVWVAQPLDAGDAFTPGSLAGGRLLVFENRLWLFNAFGGALSFVPQAGCSSSDAGS